MKIYLTKTRSGLHPLSEHDAENLRSWPLGQTREVDCRELHLELPDPRDSTLALTMIEGGREA